MLPTLSVSVAALVAVTVAIAGCAKNAAGQKPVNDAATAAAAPQHPTDATFLAPGGQPVVQALGADFPARAHRGETFVVKSYLKVLGPLSTDVDIGVLLISSPLRAMVDLGHPPLHGSYPSSRWKTGELVVDSYEVKNLTKPGPYQVFLCLQTPDYGRFHLQGSPLGGNELVLLGSLDVE
jgi:hypothetical protein